MTVKATGCGMAGVLWREKLQLVSGPPDGGEGKLKMNSMESAGGTKKPAVLRGNGGFF